MSSASPIGISDVKGLFANAVQQGDVSQAASQIMINSLNDTNILGCTGVGIDELTTDSVTLISLVLDCSFSMQPNEKAVCEAYDELVVKAMRESKQAASMLISCSVFDESVKPLYGFKKVSDIGKIGSQYQARGNATAVYDAAINAMTGVRAYAKNLNDGGVSTKCVVVVFSDGGNNTGAVMDPSKVKTVADDCVKSEMFYLVYVGFKASPADNLDAIGHSMGFANVLTTSNSPSDVRKAMGLVSQSTIRKSQTQIGPSNSFFQ
jgi:hypothetical protein